MYDSFLILTRNKS